MWGGCQVGNQPGNSNLAIHISRHQFGHGAYPLNQRDKGTKCKVLIPNLHCKIDSIIESLGHAILDADIFLYTVGSFPFEVYVVIVDHS